MVFLGEGRVLEKEGGRNLEMMAGMWGIIGTFVRMLLSNILSIRLNGSANS